MMAKLLANLPKYFNVGKVRMSEDGQCKVNVSIKWWGWPIVFIRVLRKNRIRSIK